MTTDAEEAADKKQQTDADRYLAAITVPIAVTPPEPDQVCHIPPGESDQASNKTVTMPEVTEALSNYASALAALTTADDRTKFDAAVAQLEKSAAALATTVGMAGGPAISAASGATVGASVAAIGWVVGTYLDHKRYEKLAEEVSRNCLPVRTLATALGLFLNTGVAARIAYDNETLDYLTLKTNKRLSTAEYITTQEKIDNVLADLNSLNGTHPKKVAEAIRKTHDELAKAIANGGGQSKALILEVQTLATTAAALRAAISAQEKAK
ncbi:MAG: hypothetical protein ACRYGK_18650 [Janthinobacterium lividum]